MNFEGIFAQFAALAVALVLAPLLSGWVNMCRAWLQNRGAPPLLQPFRTLHKLFWKESVVAHGATAIIDIEQGFPVTVCDSGAVALAQKTARALYGDKAWRTLPSPAMGAEDFSYVLQKVPGAMVFLGATPEGGDWRTCCALHSNRMVLDETVMARGVAMHCAYAEAFLAEGFE